LSFIEVPSQKVNFAAVLREIGRNFNPGKVPLTTPKLLSSPQRIMIRKGEKVVPLTSEELI
jgi:hypothetical protein